jgi:hypothetical protein
MWNGTYYPARGPGIKIEPGGVEAVRTLSLFLLMTAAIADLRAQSAEQPLTNADIEAMVAGGLPETTILFKIEDAVDRGMVNLDASTRALVALKEKGASERVLNQVLWAEPFKEEWLERMADLRQIEDEERAAPGFPDSGGVYFRRSSEWIPLHSFLVWLPLYTSTAWMRKAHEYSVPAGHGDSALQIAEPQPGFYVRMPGPGENWMIVRATSHNDQRELRLASGDGFSPNESITPRQPTDVQKVGTTQVAGSIFTLRPNASLGPGPYVLCTDVQGGPGLKLCYDFDIRP